MQRTNPEIDIILDILKAMMQSRPGHVFFESLYQQYCERGSLSKKQLEGLHDAALKSKGIHPGKLATLQAIIMKKPTKYRSEIPKAVEPPQVDEKIKEMIDNILSKYPEHKRVLFFKAKFLSNNSMIASEIEELKKFHTLLNK
ncbi:MAG: hypothetical protein WKF35_08130 [Ferruginibacter sp.]